MVLCIDASNIRSGGGLTHLVELLSQADPGRFGFSKVVVWSGRRTLSKLPERVWLETVHCRVLDMSLPFRVVWQWLFLPKLARRKMCSVLFVPGGTDRSGFTPFVTMSRNMLPFEDRESARYGLSAFRIKLWLLRRAQMDTFSRADGLIFLTDYAKRVVREFVSLSDRAVRVIPHGLNPRFFRSEGSDWRVREFSEKFPCRILYVSAVDAYKHQWNVVMAVAALRDRGVPVVLDLVGPATKASGARLAAAIDLVDPVGEFVRHHDAVPHSEIDAFYHAADINVFASTCENMPNILLESMASGAAVASSDYGPMPEVLGEDGVYFDPLNIASISDALSDLVMSSELRRSSAISAMKRVAKFSWNECADRTFAFLAYVAARKSSDVAANLDGDSF